MRSIASGSPTAPPDKAIVARSFLTPKGEGAPDGYFPAIELIAL